MRRKNKMDLRIIRLADGEDNYYDEYFIVKGEDFEEATELCDKAKEIYYNEEYNAPSLWEVIIDLFNENNIEFTSFSCRSVDYTIS